MAAAAYRHQQTREETRANMELKQGVVVADVAFI